MPSLPLLLALAAGAAADPATHTSINHDPGFDYKHPIFNVDNIQCSDRTNTIALEFSNAFQQYNNLGGMGPDDGLVSGDPDRREFSVRQPFEDYKYPAGIRYANLASTYQSARPDTMLAYFCGQIPGNLAQATFKKWPVDGPASACDPWESPANYKQFTSDFFSEESNLQYGNALLAAVAWSGRIMDAPASNEGRTLNAGILAGTKDSFSYAIDTTNGRATGMPGNIPAIPVAPNSAAGQPPPTRSYIQGMNVENERLAVGITGVGTNISPYKGTVPWEIGYRQALGCYPCRYDNGAKSNSHMKRRGESATVLTAIFWRCPRLYFTRREPQNQPNMCTHSRFTIRCSWEIAGSVFSTLRNSFTDTVSSRNSYGGGIFFGRLAEFLLL